MKQRQRGKQGRGNGKKEKASVAETGPGVGKGKEDHKAEILKTLLKSTEGHSEILERSCKNLESLIVILYSSKYR